MKILKSSLKIIVATILALLLIVIVYVLYVIIDYHRIDDNLSLIPENNATQKAEKQTEYSLMSWNIGFGAYSNDFSFFMDGGKESRAYSEAEVQKNLSEVTQTIKSASPDILFLQEVDESSTRSYGINQQAYFREQFSTFASVYAVNYDSAYLFYPIFCPHGKSKSGILTFSPFTIISALRRSLPIDDGFSKFVDLDRCYSVTKVQVEGGKELILINLHLSAYSADGSINEKQLALLYSDMTAETRKGNYVIAAGDFNQDLLGNSESVFNVPAPLGITWNKAFDLSSLPADISLYSPKGESYPVASCRNCDIGYEKGVTFELTVDGFLVSDNVSVVSTTVLNCGFENSDHNPVMLKFLLS